MSANVDSQGGIYATGVSATSPVDGVSPFLEKFDSAGSSQWTTSASIVCPPGESTCGAPLATLNTLALSEDFRTPNGIVAGQAIGFDPAGNVVVGSFGSPVAQGSIDFGVGTFPLYSRKNIFVSAYDSSTGQVQWAKQVPTILGSTLQNLTMDSQGRAFLTGTFSGSMELDGQLAVTTVPEDEQVIDSFVASFSVPSPLDKTPPCIGNVDTCSSSPTTTPKDTYVPATSSAGAVVFFMPPTAIDAGHAGTSVVCAPAPNTTFPIGTSTVTCTASIPLGNHSSSTFKVTVADTRGPSFFWSPISPCRRRTRAARPSRTRRPRRPIRSTARSRARTSPARPRPAPCSRSARRRSRARRATGRDKPGADDVPGHRRAAAVWWALHVDGRVRDRHLRGRSLLQHDRELVRPVPGLQRARSGRDLRADERRELQRRQRLHPERHLQRGNLRGRRRAELRRPEPVHGRLVQLGERLRERAGQSGAVCRAAGSSCDSAETCSGTNATCPINADKVAPALNPGTNQTVVGTCSSTAVSFTIRRSSAIVRDWHDRLVHLDSKRRTSVALRLERRAHRLTAGQQRRRPHRDVHGQGRERQRLGAGHLHRDRAAAADGAHPGAALRGQRHRR